MFGTLLINEVPFTVIRIRLESGRIYFTANRQSPADGELTIHRGDQAVLLAPDGTEVLHCLLTGIPATVQARKGGWMTVDLPTSMEVEGLAAWPDKLAGTGGML